MNSTSSPCRSAFRRATSIASGELSIPVTRTPWRSWAIASAIAPRPGPDVEHPLPVLGQLDEQLGLGTRHQHAVVHEQLQLAEVGAAEDVGDRLAPHAAAHHVVERQRRVHVEALLRVRVQRRAVHAEHRSQQQLGVEPRRVDPGRLQGLDSLREGVAQG